MTIRFVVKEMRRSVSTTRGKFAAGAFVAWGMFIWRLSRPGMTVLETLGILAVSYGVIGIYLYLLTRAGNAAIPVRIVNLPGRTNNCIREGRGDSDE